MSTTADATPGAGPAEQMPAAHPGRYVEYEEYLRDPAYPERTEWVDGRVVWLAGAQPLRPGEEEGADMAAVSYLHTRLTGWLIAFLDGYARRTGNGQVLHEPFNMKLGPDLPGRSPDVFFVASEHLDRIGEKHLQGPADLVIEVVSPASRALDRVHKFAEYERGGACEYWILDPERQGADFYQLDRRTGRYQAALPDGQGVYVTARLPGLSLKVDGLWQRPLPDPARMLDHGELEP